MSSTVTTTATHTKLTPTSPTPAGDVDAKISFFVPPADGSVPYNWVEKQPEGVPQNNFGYDEHTVTISDLRGRETNYNVDKNAFAVVNSTSKPGIDFWNDESVKQDYYPEVEQVLLKNIPGSHKVVIFDHTVRRADPSAHRAPVLRAHIDQTAKSAALRVPLHVEDQAEAQELLKGRYRIVNVWRPINGAVESFPLAVGDSTTLPDDKLMPVEHRYPTRTGETAGVVYHPGTKWHYLSSMRDEERLLLQCYDSGLKARVPHTAFIDPRSTPESKPRESIEVRALVFG